ncbi:type II toxin-antitoxin system VapC family toxin [Carboxydochorda subterranea]|uniref:Type II toxin-antitoxin system VapC family toxin n=1 Tax=Carboxydichorda subterranea TaxID=3109565 RepID=A0ABZ1BU75_9FIRM|nr:type II toxin-antitoxin system VapC family toxin [Limnochorda sp. L945t]WRP16206.1 type II toxin-antitoxin system VapC family toxin [Limnochorda sp. L945t]
MSKWVLDASALLVLLSREPGSDQVEAALADGASVTTVNLSEVVAKLSDVGMSEEAIRQALGALPLTVVDFDEDLAYRAGRLRPATRGAGLSLGDRACLALARRMGVPAVTADRGWTTLEVNVAIRSVR